MALLTMLSEMISETALNPFWILILIVLALITYDFWTRIGLPPGPYGLPILGPVLRMDREKFSEIFAQLSKDYGSDVIGATFNMRPLVVLNTYELTKEMFQKRTDVADRQKESGFFTMLDKDYSGIISTSGTKWKEVRRFSISMLRDFGMGRIGAEKRIQNESRILMDELRRYKGEAMQPKHYINAAVSNIICGMVFGERFEYDNEDFKGALYGINNISGGLTKTYHFILIRYELGRKYLIRDLFNEIMRNYHKMADFVKARIAEHKASYNGDVTDLIHGFLKEVENGRDPEIFSDKMLESLIIDFFLAGSETTYTSLLWCLLAMAAYPEIQEKVHEELDQVIGDQEVSMNHKKLTPYTEAVLCEVQRHYTLVKLGAAHCNGTEDVYINGYTIPKNSSVLSNQDAIHHNESYWKNAKEFDPENFLEDGHFVNREHLIPFGIGRRSCAGEALARMELYIFFTSLMKEFTVKPETDDTVPDLVGVTKLVYQPKPFKVRMEARY